MCCGMKKVSGIINGYANLLANVNQKLAEQRMKICKACPNKAGRFCKICKCVLLAKVRDEEQQCPIGKW